jgi:hypothetical protein
MPWLQGAQGNRSRLLQGTFYGTGIMVPYLCAIVGCHSNVGMDATDNERVWKDMSREGTETKQRNRNNFSVDTQRSGVLSCRLLTTIEGKSSLRAQHTRGRRRPLGPEGLATLALRKLNRQPAGVLALNCTTFRLNHHHCVLTIAKPVCKHRQA